MITEILSMLDVSKNVRASWTPGTDAVQPLGTLILHWPEVQWVSSFTDQEWVWSLLISPRGTFPCSSKAGSAHRHFWHWDTSAIDPCCSKTPNSCFLCWRNFCFAVQTPEICDQATVGLGAVSVCKPHRKKRWGLLPSGFTPFLLPLRYKHPGNTS